jgi:hypothetical protein
MVRCAHAQEQLHAVHGQERSQGYQQQRGVGQMNGFGKQDTEMHRGVIYVMRKVNGVNVPLRIWNQLHYREWLGCFSSL